MISENPDKLEIIEQFSKVIRIFSCVTTLSDWFKNLAPLSYPIRSNTKTNRGSFAHVFPRFALAHVFTWSLDCFKELVIPLK